MTEAASAALPRQVVQPRPDERRNLPRLPGAARAKAFVEPVSDVVDHPAIAPTRQRLPEQLAAPLAFTGYAPPPVEPAPAEFVDGKAKLLRLLSFGLVQPKPGHQELAYREDQRIIREASWARSVRIAVCNAKGNSGKTPAALILGGILASERGGSVAVWDSSDAPGTLAYRAEGAQLQCISAIASDPGAFALPSTIAAAAATQSSYADVLGRLTESEFTGDDVQAVTSVLDYTYRISVADTGNSAFSSSFTKVIELADILVIPSTHTADSVNKACALLHRLQDSPQGLAQRAVVALMGVGEPVTNTEAHRIFSDAGAATVDLPYDPHIASGLVLNTRRLSRPSRIAWTRLAATVVANTAINSHA